MTPIAHIADADAWEARGDYRPPSLETEGFVHGSFAEQLPGTLARHFPDAAELLLLWIDPTGLPVTVEDTTGHGAYPHIYAAVPRDAVLASHRLTRDADGGWNPPPAPAT